MTKKNEIDLKEVQRLSGLGLTQEQIASYLGIHESTFYEWKSNKDFPEFSEALKKGKARAVQEMTNALFEEGTKNRNLGAMVFYLKNQAGWKDRIDHTSDDEKINTIPSFGARPDND